MTGAADVAPGTDDAAVFSVMIGTKLAMADAGGPGADDSECEQLLPSLRVVGPFGLFERT